MKRRDFMNLTAGGAVAAVLPLPNLAAAAPSVLPRKTLVIWAEAMARAGNPVSEGLLGQALKVSSAEASALMDRMVARGVIAAPNSAGVARAIRPIRYTPDMAGSKVQKAAVDRTKERLKAWVERSLEEPDDAPEVDPGKTEEPQNPPE